MKFQKYTEKLNEISRSLKDKKERGFAKLESLKSQISDEIDDFLKKYYIKRNLVKEAKRNKEELKKYKIGCWKYISNIKLKYIISIPFIGSMIIPAVILHVFLEIYHNTCFPLYGIPRVKARNYFVFDRHHLSYLNFPEKIFCLYCSYFNCLIAYTREIAGLTELYWCPIKHAKRTAHPHEKYYLFSEYMDAEEYRKRKTQ